MRDARLQVPLRIHTRDLRMIVEFGEKRFSPIRLSEVPDMMVKPVLAAEVDGCVGEVGLQEGHGLGHCDGRLHTGPGARGGR